MTEAQVVSLIKHRLNSGILMKEICAELNNKNIRSFKSGNDWKPMGLSSFFYSRCPELRPKLGSPAVTKVKTAEVAVSASIEKLITYVRNDATFDNTAALAIIIALKNINFEGDFQHV